MSYESSCAIFDIQPVGLSTEVCFQYDRLLYNLHCKQSQNV